MIYYFIYLLTRGYSNVQLDTKCVVGKPNCAVETEHLCSNFLCIFSFCAVIFQEGYSVCSTIIISTVSKYCGMAMVREVVQSAGQ